MPSLHVIGVAFCAEATPDKKSCDRIAVPMTQQVFKSIVPIEGKRLTL
jgi:hypothetical protein